jgi:hypothetical protein
VMVGEGMAEVERVAVDKAGEDVVAASVAAR